MKRALIALMFVLLVVAPSQAAIGITKINTNTSQTGASTTLSFSGSVAAGSTLVAGGFDYSGGSPGSPAISDTVNGAWAVKKYAQLNADSNVEIWLATFENTTGGTPTVTWDPSGSADMGGWFIAEITGASTPTSVDVIPAKTDAAGVTPSIASGTLAQANEIILAVMAGATNNGTVTIVGDVAGGYTGLVNQGDNATTQMGQAQYKIVASTASDTADWTITDVGGGAFGKVAILISIKEGSGGVTCAPTLSLLGVGRCG